MIKNITTTKIAGVSASSPSKPRTDKRWYELRKKENTTRCAHWIDSKSGAPFWKCHRNKIEKPKPIGIIQDFCSLNWCASAWNWIISPNSFLCLTCCLATEFSLHTFTDSLRVLKLSSTSTIKLMKNLQQLAYVRMKLTAISTWPIQAPTWSNITKKYPIGVLQSKGKL